MTAMNQQVVVDGFSSDKEPVISGESQGTVIGTLLFQLFINDLSTRVESKTILYADNCKVYRNVKTPKVCQEHQDDIYKLTDWKQKWDMLFLPYKCKSCKSQGQNIPLS